MLEPTIPPPIMATSAVRMMLAIVNGCVVTGLRPVLSGQPPAPTQAGPDRAQTFSPTQDVAAVMATRPITMMTYQPKTTAKAVPRLTLLMQLMPMAVRTNDQMVITSSGDKSARRTAEPLGSMKYPGLVARGFWMLKPSVLTPANIDKIASSARSSSGSLV